MKSILVVLGVVGIGLLDPDKSVMAQAWQPVGAPGTNWSAIASSAAGDNLVAAVYGGGIYTSTNSGGDWLLASAPASSDYLWSAAASSSDGLKLVAVAASGQIYTSTNAGIDWVSNNVPDEVWVSVASSSDGSNLVALCYYNDLIYHSTNAGATWSAVVVSVSSWNTVASSADGIRLVAAVLGGGIYVSTNSGAAWDLTSAPATNWSSVASSADGIRLVAADASGGRIYASTNGGGTWNLTSAPSNAWFSVASSSDGSKLVAAVGGFSNIGSTVVPITGPIYGSTDFGASWSQSPAPTGAWYAVASSANGNKLVGAIYGGLIYSWQYTPTLYIANNKTNVVVSWVSGAPDFTLQENHDLKSTSWSELTNTPAFDPMTSSNSVSLLPLGGNSFFRLKSQ